MATLEVDRSEKLSYEDARNWFWTRTFVWAVPAVAVSVALFYYLSQGLFEPRGLRIGASVGAGIAVALMGVLAAFISQQFVWMRRSWKFAFAFNSPVCAVMAGLGAFIIAGITLSFIQGTPPNPLTQARAFEAYKTTVDSVFKLSQYGLGIAAFWGFIFGSWFAMRRDKYFIEQI